MIRDIKQDTNFNVIISAKQPNALPNRAILYAFASYLASENPSTMKFEDEI